MSGLTPMQSKCLQTIALLTHDDVSPSYDEIRETLGLGSKSGVHRLVRGLRDRGRVRFINGRSRSLQVVGPVRVGVPTAPDLQTMSVADLRHHLALVCGVLAHKTGGKATDEVLNRIGARLAGRPLEAGRG